MFFILGETELRIFLEMTQVQEPTSLKSYELVTKELLNEALKKDKGGDVELLSWEIIPFTNKGDNYSSVVVTISVSYRKNKVVSECSYIGKLNPLRPVSIQTENAEKSYAREAEVLSAIIGGMNNQLERLGLDPIRTPKLFSRSLEKRREALVTENLKVQGFKMYDRMKGMDLNHSLFVVKELGRFHASSLLFEETLSTKSILGTFNCLEMAITLPIINLKVLIHADCWTNNMLFRYNEDEIPVDFRFVDLQLSTKASATSDLNYFFFMSLNGDFRRNNRNSLLTAYYESFSDVLKRAGKEPPFSYL
ncbi:hypothetical protein Anas_04967, partial [Armadillidium nasatum]